MSSAQPSVSARVVADKVFVAVERFLHVEAVSGLVLLLAAAAAFVWANVDPEAYERFWDAPLTLGLGTHVVSQSLHFWINDGLMSIFFLVVGMEIRREIHDGALSTLRHASLPLAAAFGGIAVPAAIYLLLARDPMLARGWAVPTATDIAFAVGILAILGRSIPSAVRVLLLALAIIDDLAAVIIIALFYSGGIDPLGLPLAAAGMLLVLGFQRIGIGAAYAYVLPGAVVWWGLIQAGVHPALSGALLGLMTPVVSAAAPSRPARIALRALREFRARSLTGSRDADALMPPLRRLRYAQRELLPPVVRVQLALHPWVAYGIMPLFALANAGVNLEGVDVSAGASGQIVLAVAIALVIGKPAGILLASWLAVKTGLSRLPDGVTWRSMLMIGCLGGIGFTMSIFIATLAFDDRVLLEAAKAGVLVASVIAGILGLSIGAIFVRRSSSVAAVIPQATAAGGQPARH